MKEVELTSLLRNYWLELLVIGGIFGTMLALAAPDLTWSNTDCDGPHYIYSAKYLYPSHKTSAPLFLLLGHLFLKIPYGTDAWRMSLMAVLASTVTAGFIYMTVKHHTSNRWLGMLGMVIWGGSALVISQSTIVESYALTTMFVVAGYYFSLKKKWYLAALFLGLGLAVHMLAGLAAVVIIIANREMRQKRVLGLMAACLIFYIYIPITNRPPYMWFSEGGLSSNFVNDNLSTIMMLVGGISIWDLPKRIFDTIGIMGASLGLAFLAMLYWFWKEQRQGWSVFLRQPLLWLLMLPVVLYIANLAMQTYVYMLPSIAFGTIIACMGLSRVSAKWSYAVAIVAIGLLGFNIQYYDIGRTLDSDLSARRFYDGELTKIPDGEILLSQQGWEWAMVFLYNEEEGRDITSICAGALPSTDYQKQLIGMGINLEDNPDDPLSVKSTNIAKSIIRLNDNVWTTRPVDPRTYGAEVVPAIGNEHYLGAFPKSVTDGSMDMQWKFMPSNPYDIITGAIEVEEWTWIIFSNYSVQTFTMMGTVGAIPFWFFYMVLIKKKKWSIKKAMRLGKEIQEVN